MSELREGAQGLAVSAVVAKLEREHGQARLLDGEEARRTAAALGCWHRCHVIDVGGGVLYTVGPRGGGLRRHDLGESADV
jgi:hypothetical protein